MIVDGGDGTYGGVYIFEETMGKMGSGMAVQVHVCTDDGLAPCSSSGLCASP